jgi:HAD superfamily hydrolase (TIGR01509 family)
MVTDCSDKLLIFDCDGTLVDSEMLCNVAMETCLERVGIVESAPSLLARYRGAKLSSILADIGDRHARVLPAGFVGRYRAEVSRLFTRYLEPTDGVAEALAQLSNPRCVASSGPGAKIFQALEVTDLARHFGEHIYSSYEVKSWKPDPGLFLEAARAEKFQPSECIVVEDSLLGVEAARRAGMVFLLYDPDGRYEAVSVSGGKRFSSMSSLPAMIKQFPPVAP